MGEQFVRTKEAERAVKGHEIGVLKALGIDWSSNRVHIPCPYSAHQDTKPSWNWVEKDQRAFCVCIDKYHNIFNVVSAMNGCDFEAAKLYVAETLGQQDLIETRRGGQSFSAAALLKPPADKRDDSLVVAYLAHRLDVEPSDVPMPATQAIGWIELPYWDKPETERSKPILVASPPCAVFETVNMADNRHAHRIYLAEGGAGKAGLGDGPDGCPRDPKKSAKRLDGENISGRCVWFGDRNVAPTVILTEGIETALAPAYAFRDEIAVGKVCVAAAIATAGMKAFQPGDHVTQVIVAADRDKNSTPTKPEPTYAGEKAARAFAIKHHEQIAVGIALPGWLDTKTDWLDVHRVDGVEAVRGGILDAVKFDPTDDEAGQHQTEAMAQSEIVQIEELYPVPDIGGAAVEYQALDGGEIWLHQRQEKDKAWTWRPIASPFGVVARLRYVDHHDDHGLRVAVQGMNGRRRCIDFMRNTLPRAAGSDIKAQLYGAGARFLGQGEVFAVQALKGASPEQEIAVLSRPGWHWLDGRETPIFMTPAGEIIGAEDDALCELIEGVRLDRAAGSFDGWREAIDAATTAPGCFHWVLGAAAAFVGPLIELTGLDSCGINLSGMSSLGKSTAQQLAVSAWSTPDIARQGLMQTMRTTDNAAEALAQRANGSILALDEGGHSDGKSLAKLIYMISGGSGKKRMTANAELKDSYVWRTFAVLSSEDALKDKIQRDHGKWTAGMAVRFSDIDISSVNPAVDPETLGKMASIKTNYGQAGPMFVRGLVEADSHRDTSELRIEVEQAARALAGQAAIGAMQRAALPFALIGVAGELAQAFGVLPEAAPITQAVKEAWEIYQNSSAAAAVLSPDDLAITNIQSWLAQWWRAKIRNVDGSDDARGTGEAFGWYDHSAIYIPTFRIIDAAGGALANSKAVAGILDRKELLERRGSPERLALKYVPKIGPVQNYALSLKRFRSSPIEGDFLSEVNDDE